MLSERQIITTAEHMNIRDSGPAVLFIADNCLHDCGERIRYGILGGKLISWCPGCAKVLSKDFYAGNKLVDAREISGKKVVNIEHFNNLRFRIKERSGAICPTMKLLDFKSVKQA
ncbi:MAG: hypothetical protein Q8Q06_02605 [bacterium]|nr:hypothetical protein [bacterium]